MAGQALLPAFTPLLRAHFSFFLLAIWRQGLRARFKAISNFFFKLKKENNHN